MNDTTPTMMPAIFQDMTLATARTAYDTATHRCLVAAATRGGAAINTRERHSPPDGGTKRPEAWDVATAHVVMGLSDWEAAVIFRYLLARTLLPMPDVVPAKALAKRLGQEIVFERRELWG